MERESFEDEEVAKLLNEHFVSIKVDREERPDVDRVYMTFVQVKDWCYWLNKKNSWNDGNSSSVVTPVQILILIFHENLLA